MLKSITKKRIEATFKKIEENSSLMSIPVCVLSKFKEDKLLNDEYIQMWENVLLLPVPEIKKLMLSESETGEILRSTSIFIGIK